MGATIKLNASNSGDYQRFEDAMSGLASLTDDLDNTMFKALIDSPGPEVTADVIRGAISKRSTADMAKLYPRLTETGQQHARAAMVADWLDTSKNIDGMSPNKFMSEVKDFSGQRGIMFSQEHNEWLEGVQAVVERTSRAEKEYLAKMNIPGDGAPGVSRGMAAMVLSNPILGVSTIVGARSMRGRAIKHLQGPEARDLMIQYGQLPKAERLSSAGETIFKRLSEVVRGTIAAQEDQKTEENKNKKQGVE